MAFELLPSSRIGSSLECEIAILQQRLAEDGKQLAGVESNSFSVSRDSWGALIMSSAISEARVQC